MQLQRLLSRQKMRRVLRFWHQEKLGGLDMSVFWAYIKFKCKVREQYFAPAIETKKNIQAQRLSTV